MSIDSIEEALGFSIPKVVPIILIAYFVVILAIGLWASKKVKNSEDWYVGGRSMGPWITALSHGSTSLGGGFYIAGPQFGWEAGVSALWAAPGDVFGPALNFGIIANRMRRYTEMTRALTLPEFFGHRYYSKIVRILAVLIMVFAMLISLMVEYMAMGILISCITGWTYSVSLYVGCIVIIVYTGVGGYLAVAYTDFVQAILMIVGLAVMLPICIHNVDGISGMLTGLSEVNEGLATLWGEDYYLRSAPLLILGIALVYVIGYMGQPHLVIKTMAIRDSKAIKLVPFIGGLFGFILAFGVYTLGMVGRATYPETDMLPNESAEYILPMLALDNLPAPVAGLILAGAVAAIMSTASALLMVMGSAIGNDVVGMIKPKVSDAGKMALTRMITYILGFAATIMCILPIFQIGVYQLTWVAWSVMSPAFIPCIVGGLYWKRGTREGALASLVLGSATGFAWYFTLQESTKIHTFFAALIVAIVSYIVVSMITKKPPQEVLDMFDYARGVKNLEITEDLVPAPIEAEPVDAPAKSDEPTPSPETANDEPAPVPDPVSDTVKINVLKGTPYSPEMFLDKMSKSKKMAGVKCRQVGTIYSLCWVFQIRIGLKVSENTTRYGGFYAGFDEITMTPGKVAMLPTGEEIEVKKKNVLKDKATEEQALQEAWEINKTTIIRKFRQLKEMPTIEDYVTERFYKPLYVFQFTSPDGKQKKYKAMDSLTGDLLDMKL